MDTRFQEFGVEKLTLNAWTEQRGYDSSLLLEKEPARILTIAGNAFRPDNNVKIAYAGNKNGSISL